MTRLFGLAILFGCLGVVYLFEGTAFSSGAFRLFHWPAIVLTGIGPLSLVILCSDWKILSRTATFILGTSAWARQRQHDKEALYLHRIGSDYYAVGVEAFEELKTQWTSPYVAKVLERLSVRMSVSDIYELLEIERDRTYNGIFQCINVLGLGVRLAPSVGMLGTILGMVELLSKISDPSQIGSHMSLALLTTFYGLFFSLVLWTPLQQKLERVLEVELNGYNQVLRWLELLEKRKPTEYFNDSLDVEIDATREMQKVAA